MDLIKTPSMRDVLASVDSDAHLPRFAAIDPGILGAIAFFGLVDGRLHCTQVVDMPTMQRGPTTKKQRINAHELARVLIEPQPVEYAFLELVMGAPRKTGGGSPMGAASAFNFGHSFGIIEGVLAALRVPYETVRPQDWKKRAGLKGSDKEASRALAIRLFPTMSSVLSRKMDQNRAEAMLIGRFAGKS